MLIYEIIFRILYYLYRIQDIYSREYQKMVVRYLGVILLHVLTFSHIIAVIIADSTENLLLSGKIIQKLSKCVGRNSYLYPSTCLILHSWRASFWHYVLQIWACGSLLYCYILRFVPGKNRLRQIIKIIFYQRTVRNLHASFCIYSLVFFMR